MLENIRCNVLKNFLAVLEVENKNITENGNIDVLRAAVLKSIFQHNGTVILRGRQNVNGSLSDSRRCSCVLGVCKCCTGYIMDLLNQKACMKVTYHPGDFAFDVAMSMNNRILYENSLSGN